MGKDAKYVVRLDAEEREQLHTLVDKGRGSKSVRKRARILLKTDESEQGPGWTDERAAEFAEVGLSTVHRVRQQLGPHDKVYEGPLRGRDRLVAAEVGDQGRVPLGQCQSRACPLVDGSCPERVHGTTERPEAVCLRQVRPVLPSCSRWSRLPARMPIALEV